MAKGGGLTRLPDEESSDITWCFT